MRYTERFDVLRAVDNDGTEHHAIGIKIKDGYSNVAYEKLFKLEDIEDDYGIELITFFDEIKGTMTEDFIKDLIIHIKKRL